MSDEIALARQVVPLARLSIFTNGDVLKHDRLETLLEAGVTHVRVKRYPVAQAAAVGPDQASAELRSWRKRTDLFAAYPWKFGPAPQGLMAECAVGNVLLQVIRPALDRYNYRGDTVPFLARPRGQVPCLLTTTSAAIDRLGQLKMCCNVYPNAAGHDSYIIGSLAKESFASLWFSPRMTDLRSRHRGADWTRSPICVGCSHRGPSGRARYG